MQPGATRLAAAALQILLALIWSGGCGRIGFDPLAAGEQDDAASNSLVDANALLDDANSQADASLPPQLISVTQTGTWSSNSELRRTLAVSVSKRVFTFATWYKSDNTGSMFVGAGVASASQSFLWADSNGGSPFFQHQVGSTGFQAAPDPNGTWPHLNQWHHIVLAVDLDAAQASERVRWWINGAPMPLLGGPLTAFPQGTDLYLGDAVVHTIGNKWAGAFDWTGQLAETYIIWGSALDASNFVAPNSFGAIQSVKYTGPVTEESVYFDYATPGVNGFPGNPDWTASSVQTSAADLPY